MIAKPVIHQKPKNSALINNISIKEVKGGEETNPLWIPKVNNQNFKEAIARSLQQATLYQAAPKAKYNLYVNLESLEQPALGFSFTVACKVHYKLLDAKTKLAIFDQHITSTYTAKVSDALYAPLRMKIANEGAAKANIEQFTLALYQLPIK